jgi:hypothetical protein
MTFRTVRTVQGGSVIRQLVRQQQQQQNHRSFSMILSRHQHDELHLVVSSLPYVNTYHPTLQQQQQQSRRYHRNDVTTRMINNNNNIKRIKPYGNALVLGSTGVLGTVMKQYLLQELHMNVLGVDMVVPSSEQDVDPIENDSTMDGPIYKFCHLLQSPSNDINNNNNSNSSNLTSLTHTLLRSVHDFVTTSSTSQQEQEHPYLDVIIVASGGFEMDPPMMSKQQLKNHHRNNDDNDTTSTTTTTLPNIDSILHYSTQYIHTIENMYTKNFHPVIAASIVAQYYMNPLNTNTNMNYNNDDHDETSSSTSMKGTLMVVFGATSALQPTPTMIGYGSSKNAVHYYIQTFGTCTGGNSNISNDIYRNLKSIDNKNNQHISSVGGIGGPMSNLQDSKLVRQSGRKVNQYLPCLDHLTVIGILPTMVDTPNNRQYIIQQHQQEQILSSSKVKSNVNGVQQNENEDERKLFSTLISPHDIVNEIGVWITTPSLRPHTGALIKVTPPTTSNTNSISSSSSNTKVATARFELVR